MCAGHKVLFNNERVISVDADDLGKGVVVNVMVAKELSAFSEGFLHEESHAYDLGAGLAAEVDYATGSMSVSQKIINEDDLIVFC